MRDRRTIQLQIDAVMVTYRIDMPDLDAASAAQFHARAIRIVEGLAAEVDGDPELEGAVRDALKELRAGR